MDSIYKADRDLEKGIDHNLFQLFHKDVSPVWTMLCVFHLRRQLNLKEIKSLYFFNLISKNNRQIPELWHGYCWPWDLENEEWRAKYHFRLSYAQEYTQ